MNNPGSGIQSLPGLLCEMPPAMPGAFLLCEPFDGYFCSFGEAATVMLPCFCS